MLAAMWGSLWAVYEPTLRGPLIFDDEQSILKNSSITKLWPLVGDAQNPGPLNAPRDYPTAGRPLANLSLAMNYHFSEFDPLGYHVFNLIVHALTALLLWRVVAGTLRLEYFSGRFDAAAEALGFVAAMIWALHPLNTESVQYITQRTELMYGFFYFLTLYCAMRYWNAASLASRNVWLIAATLACTAGMCCKEMMVSAPLIVLLFERTFVSGSFEQALRKSWRLYAGLLFSWIVMLGLSLGSPHGSNTGFHVGIAAHEWWFTQANVLLRYLKLVVWPWPLSIRYATVILSNAQALPSVLIAGALIIVTLVLLWRKSGVGFLFAWAGLIISPTLVVPMPTEVMAERRMYLPLAALAVLVVIGGDAIARRIGRGWIRWPLAATAPAVILCLSLVSANRLSLYLDPVALWRQAVREQPNDYLAHSNLAYELSGQHHVDEAIAEYAQALKLNPHHAVGHNGLGIILASLGRNREAIDHFQQAAIDNPDYAEAHNNWGNTLQQANLFPQAIEQYHQALAIKPDYFEARNNLGAVLFKSGQVTQAIQQYQLAVQLKPDYTEAYVNLALAYAQMQQPSEAIAMGRKALELAQSQGRTELAQKIQAWLSHHGG